MVNVTTEESPSCTLPQQKEGSLLVPVDSPFHRTREKNETRLPQGGPKVSFKSESFTVVIHGHCNFCYYLGCMEFYLFALILKPQITFFFLVKKIILNITLQEQNFWLKNLHCYNILNFLWSLFINSGKLFHKCIPANVKLKLLLYFVLLRKLFSALHL